MGMIKLTGIIRHRGEVDISGLSMSCRDDKMTSLLSSFFVQKYKTRRETVSVSGKDVSSQAAPSSNPADADHSRKLFLLESLFLVRKRKRMVE